MTPSIELRGATRRHPGGAVIGPIHLSVARGETVALIGPSGCGKSTILRLVLALVPTDEGEAHFLGEPVSSDPALRRRIGYVVQGGALFPHLSAADNATLVARHLGWDGARIGRRLAELATLARLPASSLTRFPSELSGGQAQRVSLIRALFLDPEVLLLDEPLGALDPITRAELQEDLRRAFDDLAKTVLFVTHDLAEAAFFSRRLVLLREGRVVQEGSINDLASAPAEPFVARFVHAQRRLVLPAEPRA